MPIKKFNVSSITPGSITGAAIEPTVLTSITPKITGIAVANNAYSALDDTAVDVGGGYIVITGTGFAAGCSVLIGSLVATSVSFVNSTTVRAQVPAQAAGTYTVYLTNTDGGVAIRINGLNYSSTPTWSTTSPLTSGSVDIPISVQLSASSNSTVSYAVQAGSTLPPGLTLSNVGVLSGTITGISVETTYNFTIEATDLELQNTPRAFSITITVNDQYFEYVTSLLSASTPASTFASDASANAFAVAVNGDTRPTNFGPYTPGYYSNYFSGSTRLTAPSGAKFAYGTGTFTIEAWVYPLTYQAGSYPGSVIYSQAEYGQNYLMLTIGGSGEAAFTYGSGGGSGISTAAGLVPLNAWTHVAAVREGTGSNQFKIYVNGVAQVTSTLTFDFSNTTMSIGIGSYPHDNSSLPLRGYISNLRIVKGAVVYTSNFTPSATPLTANADTSLLTCQSNRFIDESSSPSTITVNGAVEISPFDPFVPSTSFAGRGSGYFDGTGDSLVAPSNAAFQFGTADFTVETWIYLTSYSQYAMIFENGGASGGDTSGFSFGATTTNGFLYVYTNGSFVLTGNTAVALNTWCHVAVVRSGGTHTLYLNGVSTGTMSTVYNYTGTGVSGQGVLIGRNASSNTYFTGYMSNYRVVKGTAVYTTNFTPPTTPLTAVANTSLLTLQNNQPTNNSMFLDSSTNNFNITRNGNTTQGTFSPYGGGWSNYFDGSTSFLNTSSSANLGFGTGDFTVEFFICPTAILNGCSIYHGTTTNSFIINTTSDGKLIVRQYGVADLFTSAAALSVNTWNHVAVARAGTTLSLWLNGSRANGLTGTNSTNWATTAVYIGRADTVTPIVQGYISNVRTVKGTAVYNPANVTITVPTAPLTPIAGTALLTCADNRFIDDSADNLTITRNGNPTVQRFNPFNPVITTPTSYSGYFDGTGDYLSVPTNAAFSFGTGDFTIEGWTYLSSNTGAYRTVFDLPHSSGQVAVRFGDSGSYNSLFQVSILTTAASNVYSCNQSQAALVNQWVHFAFTRSSGVCRLFLNGTLQSLGTGTNPSTFPSTSFNDSTNITNNAAVGIGDAIGAAIPWIGYISNVRVLKGTALYTTNFTPSTTPLTAIANTSLLTCQSATFVDASTNAFTITANGDTVSRQFNPFGWTSTSTAYTPTVYGGSAYFDGTGDYLSLTQSALAMGTGNFTIECWAYITGSVSNTGIWQLASSLFPSSTSGLSVAAVSSAWQIFYAGTTASGGTAALNTWYHLAIARSGTNLRLYVNGISVISVTDSTNYTGTAISIGGYYTTGYLMTGYISDMRITAGVARYTSNFQPPIAPLAALQNTVLLNNMTGAGIYDSAMMVNYETVGNASINTTLKKYGNTSMYFDGTGDYLITPASQNFVFGTGDFTIECWLYLTATGADDGVIIELRSSGATGNGFVFNTRASGGGYVLNFYTDSAPNVGSTVLSLNTWNHVAVTRSGSTVQLFSNGAVSATITKSNNFSNSPNPTIGQSLIYGNSNITGYIDDLRITRGVARYTANFTPPTSPFLAR